MDFGGAPSRGHRRLCHLDLRPGGLPDRGAGDEWSSLVLEGSRLFRSYRDTPLGPLAGVQREDTGGGLEAHTRLGRVLDFQFDAVVGGVLSADDEGGLLAGG